MIIVRKLQDVSLLLLYQLPIGRAAFIDKVNWDILSLGEAQRLREFGIGESMSIETLHRGGLLGGGALACRVGRMVVAMRRDHAAAIHVRTGPQDAEESPPKP